jgi:biotin carboxylase
MSRKTLLVLAASLNQIPVIEAARRLGYRVVTSDNVPDNPGHALADTSYCVDTTHLDGILDVAVRERVNGVIAAATDVAVPTAAYVAEKLGLPGVPYETARLVCDKGAFRDFLAAREFPVAPGFTVRDGFEPPAEIFTDRWWVLKPTCSSGSKGVFIITSLEEYQRRLPETMAFSRTREAVLEEHVHGSQQTCEGFLVGGEPRLCCILDRQTVAAPFTATCGHRVPTRLPDETVAAVTSLLVQILAALGVQDGPFDCDFVVRGNAAVILEMSPRMGGNSISRLVRSACDFDLVEHSILQACADAGPVPRAPIRRSTAVVLFGAEKAGTLQYDAGEIERLRHETWIDSIAMDVAPGVGVEPFINGRHRVGEAIVVARSREDLDRRVEELGRRVAVRTL